MKTVMYLSLALGIALAGVSWIRSAMPSQAELAEQTRIHRCAALGLEERFCPDDVVTMSQTEFNELRETLSRMEADR